ncbi:MAG: glycosyltransferase family 2 protein, partial [Candidatus Shapirobacteria bacterium]|nr:glycosyltransferase family 2 protein [Candidatus Shapirobacteria bacterium]
MNQINFSIIIPNHNGAKFLPKCLDSLQKAINNCPNSKFEIVIVDNNSQDNSLQIVQNFNFKDLKIIRKSKNLGFASAINLGIKKSKYDFVIPCNNDLHLKTNWFKLISQTIKENKDPKIITFFGTVLDKEGTHYESQGLKFFIQGKAQNISNGKTFSSKDIKNHNSNKLIWGASAALVVYQKDILQKVGLFDNDFFAYEEDVDLSLRLHKLGFKTLYIPQAICYHLGGGTSNTMGNFRQKMDFKNWIYIIIKNYSTKEFWVNLPAIFIERLRNFSFLVKNTSPK